MFEASRDQAAGLRQLFRPRPWTIVPLGCTTGDASDRASVEEMARALARTGCRPVLVDLLDRSSVRGARPFEAIDAHRLLPEGTGAREFARFADALRVRTASTGEACDVALVAADPLRLADLTAGIADRIVLVARARGEGLARTYSQIKAMHLAYGLSDYFTVFLDVGSRAAALASHRRLADTAARFLGADIEFGGVVGSPAAGGTLVAARDTTGWDRFAENALRWSRPVEACPGVRERRH